MDGPVAAVEGYAELLSPEPLRSAEFYGGLFGWSCEQVASTQGVRVECSTHGRPVASITQPPKELTGSQAWASFVAVDDINVCMDRVSGQGGKVMSPLEPAARSPRAIASDPSGAVFGLRQRRGPDGRPTQPAGSMVWNELQSTDLPVALQFYARVFGWQWDEVPGSDGYMVGHCPAAATSWGATRIMCHEGPKSASAGTSAWTLYFAVQDCVAVCARAVELRGSVFQAPEQIGPGIYAGIRDPGGGTFMVGHMVQLSPRRAVTPRREGRP